MQDYETRLRTLERRACCYCIGGFICLLTSGILLTARTAQSQAEIRTYPAPFRVIGSTGKTLFEIKDSPYGGRLYLYPNGDHPIFQVATGEYVTDLTLSTGSSSKAKARLGVNSQNGFIDLTNREDHQAFKRP